MIPANIVATLSRSLHASHSLASYLATAPNVPPATRDAAQRDLEGTEEALAWLATQQEAVEQEQDGQAVDWPVVAHEGLRWPAYGTHRRP